MSSNGIRADARPARDLRLDFFRGMALFFIFFDHIGDNPVGYLTLRSFSLADAAEVFIFISGYTAALVYGQRLEREGALYAAALVWRRAWTLYVAHLCLFMLYSAEVAYTVQHFNNPLFSDELGIGDFLQHPVDTLLRVLTLRFQPTFLDILPLYIALLAVFPVWLLAMRRHLLAALLPSAAIYLLAQATGLNLPGNEEGDGWYFNPFAWQLLFVIGGCLGYAAATGRDPLRRVPRGLLVGGAAAFALFAMVVRLSWTLHEWQPHIPGLLMRALWPMDKSMLHPLRIVSILSLAVLVARFVPRDAAFMRSRPGWLVVLCGQHSLDVFSLSILLSLLGNIVLTFVSRTYLSILGVNLAGVGLMVGLGLLAAWFGGGGRLPPRPVPAGGRR